MTDPADVQASFAATLVDEWVRAGVTDVVMAPGSRSTPLLVAVAGDGRLRSHVVLDERSAGFVALGLGLARGRPAVVVTTSGTAAVELHPAVVEAHQAGVPLLAVTADRPAELHGVGAPQTIEQEGLFGGSVRWAASPGVADPTAAWSWRSLASRSVAETVANPAGPGPVHLNLAFREPLLGQADVVPPGRRGGAAWHRVAVGALAPPEGLAGELVAMAQAGRRGLIVAGAGAGGGAVAGPGGALGSGSGGAVGSGSGGAVGSGSGEAVGSGSGGAVGSVGGGAVGSGAGGGAVQALAAALGWPVLADPPSGARVPGPWTVATADALLRVPSVAAWRPDVVLRLGQPWASRVLSTWLSGLGADAEQVVVDPYGRWPDPERHARRVVRCDAAALCRAVVAASSGNPPSSPWATQWARAEGAAQAAIDSVLAGHPEPTEPGLARTVAAALPARSTLFVSSSMPVRDLEWFARPRSGVTVLANRGANGIDGIVSTALGIALTGPVTALMGDLAFLYDAGSLLWAGQRGVDCTLVVVDNDGGGIFSFLPQAQGVAAEQFERYWGTPHGRDLARVAAAYDIPVTEITALEEMPAALGGGGVRMVLVRTDRAANVALHREIERAVAAAVDAALDGAPGAPGAS